jgi:hypothetical protein
MSSVEELIANVREEIRRGDVLTAWDKVAERVTAGEQSVELLYWGVLALARAGATEQALAHFAPLAGALAEEVPRKLRIRIGSLFARLQKDRALNGPAAERSDRIAAAARAYEEVFFLYPDPFPGVNASTLWALGGNREHAREIAAEVLRLCSTQAPTEPEEEYYLRASEAEAALALGDRTAAELALGKAGACAGHDYAALAGTRKQLRLLCASEGIDPAILAPLATPTIAYTLGPSGVASLPPDRERALRERVDRVLAERRVGFVYGSLSAGAEIVFAEAALDRGIELKVVFPFEIEEYRQLVVAPAGGDWLARFDRCLAGATEPIHFATTDSYLGDNGLFLYASRMAMGLALSKATTLDTEARLLVVRDEPGAARGDRFVDHEADFWASSGFPVDTVDTLPAAASRESAGLGREAPQRAGGRVVKSMLFGDVKGFSKLREVQLPVFAREVLGTFSRVLESFGTRIPVKNSWGDALYVVAEDAVTGADCALSLQEAIGELKPEQHGLPAHLGLRLGGHVGPVFPVDDPVLGYRSYMGVHVSRTARIEPITPVGSVYVTEAFAAALALDRTGRFTTEYVGHMPAAKDWGKLRVYVLRRAPDQPPAET